MNALTTMEQQLLQYVQEYMRYADLFCMMLRTTFQLDFTRISRMQRNTVMGQHGKIQGLTYSFHGCGCAFQTKQIKLDLDFDTLGQWNGVDLWRIWLFVHDNKLDVTWSEHLIEAELNGLLKKHYLYQVERQGDQHFFYLNPCS